MLASLYVHSLYVTKLEDVADAQSVSLPSHVLSRSRANTIDWLSTLSEVSTSAVGTIIDTLTFDVSHPHVTAAHQPFVPCQSGQLCLLPRMLQFLDLPKMYVAALNKTELGKSDYSHAINTIEDVGVSSIAADIRVACSSTLQVIEKKDFTVPSGEVITPDIVILGVEEVLIIDVKYANPPLTSRDVARDLAEMKKWHTRMGEYSRAFTEHAEILSQHFDLPDAFVDDIAVYGLILVRWPLPIPAEFAGAICCVDWPSLRENQGLFQEGSIADLFAWAATRPDLSVSDSLVWTEKTVQVDEWSYRYSVLSGS